jgi:hypothetical protein
MYHSTQGLERRNQPDSNAACSWQCLSEVVENWRNDLTLSMHIAGLLCWPVQAHQVTDTFEHKSAQNNNKYCSAYLHPNPGHLASQAIRDNGRGSGAGSIYRLSLWHR